jgi:hypothetical protein
MAASASTTEAALEACKTGNLPLLQSIAEPKGTALPDMSPPELASISTKLPPVYKMLEAAARRSQIQVLRYLRPLYPARIDRHSAIAAISTGSIEIFAELASHDNTIITQTYGIFGNCLTSALTLQNPTGFLTYLLDRGADPNDGLGTGFCPLSRAAVTGDVELLKLLLRYGSQLKDSGVLWYAAFHGRRDAVEFLLDHGVDANDRVSRCLELSPAIHVAIKQDHLDIAELLLSRGADPFIKDNCGATAIEIAQDLITTKAADLLRAWTTKREG